MKCYSPDEQRFVGGYIYLCLCYIAILPFDYQADELLTAGDCAYEVILDTSTKLPHLMQLLALRIRPQLLLQPTESTMPSTGSSQAQRLAAIYRRLPFIYAQCGIQAAHDLLGKVRLIHDIHINYPDY